MSVVTSLYKACFVSQYLRSYLLKWAGHSALSLVLVPDFAEMTSSNKSSQEENDYRLLRTPGCTVLNTSCRLYAT